MTGPGRRPSLAVWKFASCDGCQLGLLDMEDELLALAEAVKISYFLEVTRAVAPGPYDVSLVEGSVTTQEDVERLRKVRAESRFLVTMGACATSGGIQSLRNYAAVGEYVEAVYAHPTYIATLSLSTPISSHVPVDFENPRLPDQPSPAPRGAHGLPGRPRPPYPDPHGLPGVQSRRQRVRAGGRGHALPRSRDNGGLPRSLPPGRTRLLWLLRAGGDGQYRVAGGAAVGGRGQARRRCQDVPELYRRRARVRKGGRGP